MEGLPEDLTNNNLVYFMYAPMSSVDVERSFSVYKNLLSSNRRRFTFENIRKYLIVQCNFQGKEINKIIRIKTFKYLNIILFLL